MDTYCHHISGFCAVRANAETAQAELLAHGLPSDRVQLFDSDVPTAAPVPKEDSKTVLKDVLVDGSVGTAVGAAAVHQPPAADIDNTSVAGEEDPGAALEFTRPGSTGPERPDAIRPARCGR